MQLDVPTLREYHSLPKHIIEYGSIIREGLNASVGAQCPYKDALTAAAWRCGYLQAHGFAKWCELNNLTDVKTSGSCR